MTHRLNRRRFVRNSSLAGFGYWVSGRSTAWGDDKSPNEKLNIACIGVGGKGRSDSEQAGRYGNIVAICDIDDERLRTKGQQFPHAKMYHDFRKLLDEMGSKIDAVTVSTADHTHAPAAVMAMRLGKHVYCQKPLTHSVYEARLMRDTARQYKVATQMGNQGTADSGFRRGVEIIRSGAIGQVSEVHVWTNRPFKYWKQAPDVVARPTEMPPVPKHVHWDLFLGPAAERPYHPIYHPHDWRGWWAFGTGALGDMACHTANLPFMALKLGYPTRISAQSSEINPETYPAWATITYEFHVSPRSEVPPVKLIWYEGAKDGKRNLPALELFEGEDPPGSGSLMVGDKGKMFSPSDYGQSQVLLPKKAFEGYQVPTPTIERLEGQRGIDDAMKGEWVRAIKGGPPAMSNFDYAAVLTETMLLGNVAVRVGKPFSYDATKQVAINCPEAAQYIKPAFRKGWVI